MASPAPPLLQIFRTFFIMGLLTFGGGYGMIPIMQHDFVVVKGWMTNAQFNDAVAVGLVSPGPVAILATFIGYRLNSILGAILATIGVFTPSILIVYMAGKFYEKFEKSHYTITTLPIINSAVIGLLCAAVMALGKPSIINVSTSIMAIVTFSIITWTKISPIWTIIICGLIGLILF